MKRIICFIVFVFAIAGCSPSKNAGNIPSIQNTTWTYTDHEKSYEVTFKPNGKLSSTNPNEITPDNDFWEQDKDTVRFSYNNKYAWYAFKYSGAEVVKGVGRNSKLDWKFKMVRKK
jgi:hypothetical protein